MTNANRKIMPLVERSPTAKKAGGPRKIRALPLTERLIVCAKIAHELGRDESATKAMKKAYALLMEKGEYCKAASVASEAGMLKEANIAMTRGIGNGDLNVSWTIQYARTARELELKEIAKIQAERAISQFDSEIDRYADPISVLSSAHALNSMSISVAELAKDAGFQDDFRKAVKVAMITSTGEYSTVGLEEIYSKFGGSEELRNLAREVIDELVRDARSGCMPVSYTYDQAFRIAVVYGLEQEKKKIGQNAIHDAIVKTEFYPSWHWKSPGRLLSYHLAGLAPFLLPFLPELHRPLFESDYPKRIWANGKKHGLSKDEVRDMIRASLGEIPAGYFKLDTLARKIRIAEDFDLREERTAFYKEYITIEIVNGNHDANFFKKISGFSNAEINEIAKAAYQSEIDKRNHQNAWRIAANFGFGLPPAESSLRLE